jgi:acetyl-CoA carboxylase biotin carboxyl carrier protein
MDAVERIRQLLEIMADHDLAELEVEEPDLKVKIRKSLSPQYLAPGLSLAHLQGAGQAHHPSLQLPAEPEQEAGEPAPEDDLAEVTSPMVGTFYRAPRPGADPYVSIGTQVEPDTVICIIEAMKVMNEIKAEVAGKVVEILVQDSEPVEFGQVLFLLEPPGQ